MVNVRPFKTIEDLDKPFVLQAEQESDYDIKTVANWLKMPVNAFLFENDKEILAQMFFIQLGHRQDIRSGYDAYRYPDLREAALQGY